MSAPSELTRYLTAAMVHSVNLRSLKEKEQARDVIAAQLRQAEQVVQNVQQVVSESESDRDQARLAYENSLIKVLDTRGNND